MVKELCIQKIRELLDQMRLMNQAHKQKLIIKVNPPQVLFTHKTPCCLFPQDYCNTGTWRQRNLLCASTQSDWRDTVFPKKNKNPNNFQTLWNFFIWKELNRKWRSAPTIHLAKFGSSFVSSASCILHSFFIEIVHRRSDSDCTVTMFSFTILDVLTKPPNLISVLSEIKSSEHKSV